MNKGGDRAIAIVSACLLDYLLEKLIRMFYIKDQSVKAIFKNDHILQSFFAKINIAYFTGLIPKFIYHDLKLICEIRNKLAHEATTNLTFNDSVISQRINKCETKPTTIDSVHAQFIVIIQLLMSHLCLYEQLLLQSKPTNLVESFNLNDRAQRLTPITKDELYDFMRKAKPSEND